MNLNRIAVAVGLAAAILFILFGAPTANAEVWPGLRTTGRFPQYPEYPFTGPSTMVGGYVELSGSRLGYFSHGKITAVYSPADSEIIYQQALGIEVQLGATGQSATAVESGISSATQTAINSDTAAIQARTFVGPVMKQIPTDLVTGAEEMGSLPLKSVLFKGLGDVGLAVGAFQVGWHIGGVLDDIFGLPGIGGEHTGEGSGGPLCSTTPCKEDFVPVYDTKEERESPGQLYRGETIEADKITIPMDAMGEMHNNIMGSSFLFPTGTDGQSCLTRGIDLPIGPLADIGPAGDKTAYCGTPEATVRGVYMPGSSQGIDKGGGLGGLGQVPQPIGSTNSKKADKEGEEHGVGPLSSGAPSAVSPTAPNTLHAPDQCNSICMAWILSQAGAPIPSADLGEETPAERPPEPVEPTVEEKEKEVEEEKTAGEILEVPKTGEESGAEYKAKAEALGFTDVEVRTLPETAIDPSKGPLEASYTVPAGGTHVNEHTKVEVEQNPENAPVPPPEGGGIGGPTLPGIKFPKLGVLCTSFPFGVPCWLINTIGSWSATAKAPVWTIVPELEIMGHKVSSASFDLAKLEPIMVIVRPAILVFASIGLVLLFYKFAMGGGAESGSNSDTSSMPAPDPDTYL